MSSTRKGQRGEAKDNYPTPAWAIERFLEEFEPLHELGPRWLEPAVGDGVICNVVDRHRSGIEWTTCDMRDTTAALKKYDVRGDHFVGNFFELPQFDADDPTNRWDVAIMNPPFSVTMKFIERCRRLAPVVIMMQRMNYVGSEERNDHFREVLPDLYVIPNRVSFTGDGKADSIEHAWHVWIDEPIGNEGIWKLLKHTPKEIRKAHRTRVIVARDPMDDLLDALFTDDEDWED